MSKILIISNLLALIIQVNSIDNPDLRNVEDLVKFAGEVKEIFSGDLNFKESSIKDESNPANSVIQVVDTIIDEIDKSSNAKDFLDQYVHNVDFTYENFLAYASDLNSFNGDTITDFIEMAVGDNGEVPMTMKKLEDDVAPTEDPNHNSIWQSMIAYDEKQDSCDMNDTLQECIFESFKIIVTIEMKALIVAEGANNFKASSEDENSTVDYDKPEQDFIMRIKKYFTELKKIMETASREVYRCDSETHVLGEDYVEFEGLFYSYMMHETEIGRRSSCGNQCGDLQSWGTKRCYKVEYNTVCPDHPCRGLIHSCGWIGGDVDICEENADQLKRYRFIRSYSNGWYGKWDRCDEGRYYEYRQSYLRFSSCSTCLCTCSESLGSSKAIRTISLRPQTSNIEENNVIINVQFVSQDQMIQVQIKEAPLQPNGEVDKSKSKWVELESFEYDSESNDGSFSRLNDSLSDDNDNSTGLTRDVDYAFITKDDNILNIDQVSGGPGYVLTGVRFNRQSEAEIGEGQGPSPIELAIRVTPYDYITGQLNTNENDSMWITAATQPNPPEAYNNDREDIGMDWNGYKFNPDIHHTSDTRPNRFVKFDKSSTHSDIGQTVLPIFDSRPLKTENKLAPNGIGIIYRRAKDYGGLLAFELLTISLADGLNSGESGESASNE